MCVIQGAGLLGLHKFPWNFLLADTICAFSGDCVTFTSIKLALAYRLIEECETLFKTAFSPQNVLLR